MSQILSFFHSIIKELSVFFCSMLPIIELRGAIPLGAFYNFSLIKSFLLAVTGNIIPIPFIIIFAEKIFNFFRKFKITRNFVEKFEDRIAKKAMEVKTATQWGLMIFVAIPLPGTGAWTGALIAAFLQMKLKDAVKPIIFGILVAGIIVTAIAYGFLGFLSFLL